MFKEPTKKEEIKVDTEVIEDAIDNAEIDYNQIQAEKKRHKELKEMVENSSQQSPDFNDLARYIHLVDKSVLDHRKEDFTANKKFGAELKAIHRNQSKFIFIVMFLILICGMLIGGFLVAYHEDILPYIGYALDSAKTMSNLAR